MHRVERLNFHLYKPEEIACLTACSQQRLIDLLLDNQKLHIRLLSFPLTDEGRFALQHMQETFIEMLTKISDSIKTDEQVAQRMYYAKNAAFIWSNLVAMFNTVQEAAYSNHVPDFKAMGFKAYPLGKPTHCNKAIPRKANLRLVTGS